MLNQPLQMLINQKINQIRKMNPKAEETYQMLKGKSDKELKEYFQNVSGGRTNINEILNQFGIRLLDERLLV